MGDERERDSRGRFTADHGVAAEDVYRWMEPFEPYTSGEIADGLDIPRRTAYEFLEELAESDRIRKKKPEPRRAIWIRTERESRRASE